MKFVASLSQGRTAAAQCGFFTYKSVPVIFEPPCMYTYLCVYVYTYTYIQTHVHRDIHTHIHTYIYTFQCFLSFRTF